MIAQLSGKISSFFVDKNIIKKEDSEIYNYSFEVLLSTIINFTMIVVLAIITNRIISSTFYLLGFLPLRATAGGYHAKTHLRCILILLTTYILFLIILKMLPENYILTANIILSLLSVILIFALSPVEDSNKPLSENETRIFKKKSRICILIYVSIIFILFLLLKNKQLSLSIALGNVSVSLSLLASRIRNKIINSGNNAHRALNKKKEVYVNESL